LDARPASWSPPAESAQAVAAAALAVVLFLAAWALLHRGFYTHDTISDLPVYEQYGRLMVDDRRVPYRDFRPEYPPLALPAFALPAALADGDDGYRRAFEALMAACGAVLVGLVAFTLVRLRASPARTALALGLVALAPLLLGSVVLSRFDLWPALLVSAALAAFVAGRDRVGSAALGLAVAAKVYGGVLAPIALVWVWRRRGRREALVCAGIFAAALLLPFLPFLVVAPDGVLASLSRQLSRPLQIESLGSALLLALREPLGYDVSMHASHGSQNVAGDAGTAVGVVSTVLQAAALVWVWLRFARGEVTTERLVRYSAAAVVAFVAFGKVLSPQFLIWLVPLVALVGGRRGLVSGALLATALVLTQLWFPFRYWDWALTLEGGVSWLVLARDVVLVSVLVVLVGLTPRRAREPA
jgi:hypothetical protein